MPAPLPNRIVPPRPRPPTAAELPPPPNPFASTSTMPAIARVEPARSIEKGLTPGSRPGAPLAELKPPWAGQFARNAGKTDIAATGDDIEGSTQSGASLRMPLKLLPPMPFATKLQIVVDGDRGAVGRADERRAAGSRTGRLVVALLALPP